MTAAIPHASSDSAEWACLCAAAGGKARNAAGDLKQDVNK